MKICINIESFPVEGEAHLKKDLCSHGETRVVRTSDGKGVDVYCEGSLTDCMCVVAICDLFRYGGEDVSIFHRNKTED